MGSGKSSIARFLREAFSWHVLSTDAIRKQISGVGENTRVYVPYNVGLYSPEMNQKTYEEVCRRAENLLQAGFPVAVDGAFKKQEERVPVLEMAERTGARLVFLDVRCDPDEQRRRLTRRALHNTRSDGRVELMESQRRDFEPPNPDHADVFETISTDGPKKATRARVVEILRDREILEPEEQAAED